MRTTEYRIDVAGLRIYAHHGVLEQERAVGNEFEVTATLWYDGAAAADSDEIGRALNYAEAVGAIEDEMAVPSALLEHAAHRVAKRLCERFPQIIRGRVTIAKLHPPIAAQMDRVSVTESFER